MALSTGAGSRQAGGDRTEPGRYHLFTVLVFVSTALWLPLAIFFGSADPPLSSEWWSWAQNARL